MVAVDVVVVVVVVVVDVVVDEVNGVLAEVRLSAPEEELTSRAKNQGTPFTQKVS